MITIVIAVAAFIVAASVAVAVISRRTRVPFDQLSREDQAAAMEHRRGGGARLAGHESLKSQGQNDARYSGGPF